MRILNFKDFMEKYNLKNNTMNESELQRDYKYPINPRGSRLYSDKRFVNIDDGFQGGSHWTCFIVQDNKSYFFDSFGVQPEKFVLIHLPKPITYHDYQNQDINSKLCGSYSLYFFNLIERMSYYDASLKMYFEKINAKKCIWKLFKQF